MISSLWTDTPNPSPLHSSIEMLLDFIFTMLAPECGSVLLGTYQSSVLKQALEEECMELYGAVMWPTV